MATNVCVAKIKWQQMRNCLKELQNRWSVRTRTLSTKPHSVSTNHETCQQYTGSPSRANSFPVFLCNAFKMADHRLYWDLFFESIADLLDEYEHNLDTGDTDIRESIAIRMEYAIVALQQVAFIASNPECLPFMQCL